MDFITFLLTILKTGKASGDVSKAREWLSSIMAEVKSQLPSEVDDYMTPTIDRLFAEFDGNISKDWIKEALTEGVRIFSGGKLGKPDPGAGSVL